LKRPGHRPVPEKSLSVVPAGGAILEPFNITCR
jgi:hypothetical protein